MAKLVSTTYGNALFELALEEQSLDAMLEEVRAVSEIFEENPDLGQLLNHPQIVNEEKIKVLDEIFSNRISKELLGLIRLVVEKDHAKELPKVFEYFVDQLKEYKKIGTAYVTSAIELSDSQKSDIEKRLLDTTKYVEFEMHYTVDAALIGGLVIRIGDRVVDSSVKTKLYNLTRELSQIQLKVGENTP